MNERTSMPSRLDVDPDFDGHLERSIRELSVSERLDWIWEAMQLHRLGQRAREHGARARAGGGSGESDR